MAINFGISIIDVLGSGYYIKLYFVMGKDRTLGEGSIKIF
jgi:hypothetical protein